MRLGCSFYFIRLLGSEEGRIAYPASKRIFIFRMKELELLSPAKDPEVAIAAIQHGADAVYIGAPVFSARQSAGVSINDIRRVCDYAHLYRAKVFVALNTILYESELEEARKIIIELDKAGIDALIIQDKAILEMDIPDIPIHASTQCDNRTIEKIRELKREGFDRIVVARELNPDEIKELASEGTEIEAFIHGALCVSISGICYVSQYLAKRSANRGACAQICRLPFDLTDAEGKVIIKDRHLLSLKDMNRIEYIQKMADAGVTSFKIEGRLKAIPYVKNVTAAYSKKLDEVVAHSNGKYKRASFGNVSYTFEPDLERSFNRGYTSYLFKDRQEDPIASPETPKSKGRLAGIVRNQDKRKGTVVIDREHGLSNGDGLLIIHRDGTVEGTQVNKIDSPTAFEPDKTDIFQSGDRVYCNRDRIFETQLEGKETATRKIPVSIKLRPGENGFLLTITGPETYESAEAYINIDRQKALKPQDERIAKELSKLGQTPLEAKDIDIEEVQDYFIPASLIGEARREAAELFCKKAIEDYKPKRIHRNKKTLQEKTKEIREKELTYRENIANSLARKHYEKMGYAIVQPAYELKQQHDAALMTCRHCIKRELGHCPREKKTPLPYKEPLKLIHTNGTLRLRFDCKNCQMLILEDKE